MRSTHRFSGDLLLGGIRLRGLECELHEVPSNDEEIWSGRFRIPKNKLSLFELDRPYLLELTDGRQGRVVVHSVTEERSTESKSVSSDQLLLEFQPAAS